MDIRHALTFALLASTLTATAEPPATIHQDPPLVSVYERKVLAKEMKTLSTEIYAARKAASEDSSLAPLKDALAAAKQTKDAAQIKTARRALSDAIETQLYKQDGMPEKIKRLLDVGNLLRYDTQSQREKRRQNRTVIYAAPPTAPTNAPAASIDPATHAPASR